MHAGSLRALTPRRRTQPELIDAPGHDRELLRANLADIARVNRFLGGYRLTLRALARLLAAAPPRRELRVLDVGTGGGDFPPVLVAWARARGLRATVVGVDSSEEVLALALPQPPEVELAIADARALPHADGEFDVAVCSLLLHHLDPADAVAALRELRRVARAGVVVNDLVRSWPAYVAALVLTRVFSRNRLTRADGPASVLRAYTRRELESLAAEAGLHGVAFSGFLGYRTAMRWKA